MAALGRVGEEWVEGSPLGAVAKKVALFTSGIGGASPRRSRMIAAVETNTLRSPRSLESYRV